METTVIGSDKPKPSHRPSLLRPAGVRGPLGPRTRQASALSSLNFENPRNGGHSHRNSTISKSSSQESSLYSPGPSSPSFPPPSSPRSENDNHILSGIDEHSILDTHKPPSTSSPSVILHESPNPSYASSPAPSRASSPVPPSIVPSQAPSSMRVIVKPQQQTLMPPPPVKFESVQVQWKPLPLEAALWSLDSKELQTIVSRAIRSSASESFIRLLPTQQLDETLPAELERLSSQKASIQARYRFHTQRRTMLLQALMSFTASIGSEKDGGVDLIGKLATQISDTAAECDKLTQELVSIGDQITQVNKLIDNHWASALAIALRKLNGSYGKRTAELISSKAKVEQLKAELNDAWEHAEKLAKEMDDLDETGEFSDEDDEVMIGRAAVVQAPSQNAISASGKLIDLPRRSSSLGFSHPPLPHLVREEPPPPVSGPKSGSTNEEADDDDTRSVASKRSVKSAKSSSGRVSMVSAARTRSIRTSLGKLRIPSKKQKSRPSPGVRSAPAESCHPPVPSMPMVFSPASAEPPTPATAPVRSIHTSPRSSSGPSFLNLDSRTGSAISLVDESTAEDPPPVPALIPQPKKTEIEDIKLEPIRYLGEHTISPQRPLSVMDDIMLIPSTSRNGIEEMPHVLRKSVDELTMSANTQRKMSRDVTSSAIPSIWLNADTPKTPAERVDELMRSSSTSRYTKLKGITKRYSLPFPFQGRTSSSSNRSHSS